MLASLGPPEIGTIVLGAIVVVGLIYWRVRMGRKGRDEKHENPD